MQTTYLFLIQTDHNDAIPCMPQLSGEPGLGLTTDGISWKDNNCDVKLEIRNNEPYISKNAESTSGILPILERNGRAQTLRDNKPIRILPEDTIQIDKRHFSIGKIFKTVSNQWHAVQNSLKSAGKQKMLATAAALVLSMTAIPLTACNTQPNAGMPMEHHPWDGLSGQQLLDTCNALEHGVDKELCCRETQHGDPQFKCTYNVVDPKDNPNCDGIDRDPLKKCCEAIQEPEQKRNCCQKLKQSTNSQIVCESIPEVEVEMLEGEPVENPWDGLSGQQLLDICNSLEHGVNKEHCCFATQNEEPQFKCTYNATNPNDNPKCEGLEQEFLKECCDAIQNAESKQECCQKLEDSTDSKIKCDSIPQVPVRATAGVPKQIPEPDKNP